MTSERRRPLFDRALVTGATGFIGRALAGRLRAEGVALTCTTRRRLDPSVIATTPETTWLVGDVTDLEFVDAAIDTAKPDVIFHLAAYVTGSRDLAVVRPTALTNLIGSVNVMCAAAESGSPRVILIGSGDEPAHGAAPASPYAASKASQGLYAQLFRERFGTAVTTARVFMTYGPDVADSKRIVPHTISSLMRGDRPQLTSGRRRCDWIHIDDVIDALLALATAQPTAGRSIDVGTGELHTVREVVEMIVELVGATIDPQFGALPDRPGETENVADASVAAELAGWKASTDLRSGLALTVDAYRGG